MPLKNTIDLGDNACPWCGALLQAATWVSTKEGKEQSVELIPGEAITVCIYCGGYIAFEPDMAMRKLWPFEFMGLSAKTKKLLVQISFAAKMVMDKARSEKIRRN